MTNFTDWWVGTDTNGALPFPAGPVRREHFYLGRLGGETRADSMGFDIQAAKVATQTFAYWDLAGPGVLATNEAPVWGARQARAAIEAWGTHQYVQGKTLFLDVEVANGGWGTDQALNEGVLQGALQALANSVAIPGCYVSPGAWAQLFGPAWSPGTPFVLWLAGNANQSLPTAISEWESLPTIGAMRPMIWQYNTSGSLVSRSQDRNLTPYAGWLAGAWHPTADTAPAVPHSTPQPAPTPEEMAIAKLHTVAADLQAAIDLVEQLKGGV